MHACMRMSAQARARRAARAIAHARAGSHAGTRLRTRARSQVFHHHADGRVHAHQGGAELHFHAADGYVHSVCACRCFHRLVCVPAGVSISATPPLVLVGVTRTHMHTQIRCKSGCISAMGRRPRQIHAAFGSRRLHDAAAGHPQRRQRRSLQAVGGAGTREKRRKKGQVTACRRGLHQARAQRAWRPQSDMERGRGPRA